ncbi:hypothetical protein BH09VER1_BH09VER1_10800 [soil metagenome]
MSYRVFARKYRPQTFEEVIGQEHITRTLQNGIGSGRVAQAYLFVGPRGIGKTSTARILAKALNCQEGTSANPCGQCDACKEIAEGRSLDVIEIDGASNNGVENIRELRENAAYAPARGPYKIYLIDEVHMLSTGAFNALLKTLEEPPEHVKFIFATTEAQKVPATITSRCQRFDLRRIPTESISKHLLHIAQAEKIELEVSAADAIARAAEGGLRDAESMLDQAVAFCGDKITAEEVMGVFGFTPRETITSLMNCILARDAAGGLNIVAEQAAAGKDLSRLLNELIGYVRDLLVAGVEGARVAPREKLLMLMDHLGETEARMRWATDRKLQFDVAVIKSTHLLEQASLDDVIDALASLQAGGPGPAPRAAAPPAKPVVAAPVAGPTPVKPAPVPVAAAPKPAPVAPPPWESEAPATAKVAETAAEAAVIDAAVAWDQVAATYQSSIKYRWMTKGVFAESAPTGEMKIFLPPSYAADLKSIVGESGRRDAEGKLGEILAKKVKLVFEIGDHLEEALVEEAAPEPPPAAPVPAPVAAVAPAVPAAPAAPVAPSAESMEEFKNDPLIKKALEIFAGEIQTTTK